LGTREALHKDNVSTARAANSQMDDMYLLEDSTAVSLPATTQQYEHTGAREHLEYISC
jgi:hypothetical protein